MGQKLPFWHRTVRFFPLPGVLDGQPVVRFAIEIFHVLEDHERQDHLLERDLVHRDAAWIEMRQRIQMGAILPHDRKLRVGVLGSYETSSPRTMKYHVLLWLLDIKGVGFGGRPFLRIMQQCQKEKRQTGSRSLLSTGMGLLRVSTLTPGHFGTVTGSPASLHANAKKKAVSSPVRSSACTPTGDADASHNSYPGIFNLAVKS
jgi:hypothetical protein